MNKFFFHIISCASIVNYKIYVYGICISHFSRKASECAILTVFNFKLDLNADYHLKYWFFKILVLKANQIFIKKSYLTCITGNSLKFNHQLRTFKNNMTFATFWTRGRMHIANKGLKQPIGSNRYFLDIHLICVNLQNRHNTITLLLFIFNMTWE